ncbi:MAG TPA: hypothetical protein VF577_06035 [Allosphingosinicella sp.]|jgi:hypothetical protein
MRGSPPVRQRIARGQAAPTVGAGKRLVQQPELVLTREDIARPVRTRAARPPLGQDPSLVEVLLAPILRR